MAFIGALRAMLLRGVAAPAAPPVSDEPYGLGDEEVIGGTTVSITLTQAVPVGSAIVVFWHTSTTGTVTVTDSRGNTYTTFGTHAIQNGRFNRIRAAITTALQVGDTITCTCTASGNNNMAAVALPDSDVFDSGVNFAVGTTATPEVTHDPVATATWAVVGGYFNGDGLTIAGPAGWDLKQSHNEHQVWENIRIWTKRLNIGSPYTFTCTGHSGSNQWAIGALTFVDD